LRDRPLRGCPRWQENMDWSAVVQQQDLDALWRRTDSDHRSRFRVWRDVLESWTRFGQGVRLPKPQPVLGRAQADVTAKLIYKSARDGHYSIAEILCRAARLVRRPLFRPARRHEPPGCRLSRRRRRGAQIFVVQLGRPAPESAGSICLHDTSWRITTGPAAPVRGSERCSRFGGSVVFGGCVLPGFLPLRACPSGGSVDGGLCWPPGRSGWSGLNLWGLRRDQG
jgi:hypothetical protein